METTSKIRISNLGLSHDHAKYCPDNKPEQKFSRRKAILINYLREHFFGA